MTEKEILEPSIGETELEGKEWGLNETPDVVDEMDETLLTS